MDSVRCRDSSSGAVEASRGFSLLEIAAAISLLTIGLLALGGLLLANQRSTEVAREEALATHAFRSVSETIRSAPFDEIAATYQGHTFTIDEINASGTVTIYLDETARSVDARKLGLPMDLDGDGVAGATDVFSSYLLLPIKIEISWTGIRGPQTREHYLFLSPDD